MKNAPIAFSMPSNTGKSTTSWLWRGPLDASVAVFDVQYVKLSPHLLLSRSDAAPQATVTVEHVAVPSEKLGVLRANLCEWLATEAAFVACLTDEPGQHFSIAIEPQGKFASLRSKPLFEAKYSEDTLHASWAYAVDPSCIRIMLEELDVLMTAMGIPVHEDA